MSSVQFVLLIHDEKFRKWLFQLMKILEQGRKEMMPKKNCVWKNFFGRQKTQMKICLRTSLTWIQIICQTSFPKKIEYSIQRLVLGSDLLEVFFGFVIFFGWWRYNQVKHRILILTHHRSGSTFTGELFNLHSQKGFQIDASSLMIHH